MNLRERYINDNSFNSFTDFDVLKLLFSYCRIPQKNADSLAIYMLDEFGTFANLAEAHPEEIKSRCNVSEYTSVLISMIPKLAKLYLTNKWDKKVRLTTSTIAGKYITDLFVGKNNEAFYILCLDAQRRLNHAALISEGTVEEAPVYVRNIVQTALLYNSVSVVLAHNHPGGSVNASGADIEATRQIIRAFELLDINVLDHIIVAGGEYFSFSENGGLLGLRY